MHITIIKNDSAVYVDGKPHQVDCSELPDDFHALQWDEGVGEIEFAAVTCAHCGTQSRKANAAVTDLMPYQRWIDAWHVAESVASEKMKQSVAVARVGTNDASICPGEGNAS